MKLVLLFLLLSFIESCAAVKKQDNDDNKKRQGDDDASGKGKQIAEQQQEDPNLHSTSEQPYQLSREYFEQLMKIVKNHQKIGVHEVADKMQHNAKDETLMQSMSSNLSKLHFTKPRPDHIGIANAINEHIQQQRQQQMLVHRQSNERSDDPIIEQFKKIAEESQRQTVPINAAASAPSPPTPSNVVDQLGEKSDDQQNAMSIDLLTVSRQPSAAAVAENAAAPITHGSSDQQLQQQQFVPTSENTQSFNTDQVRQHIADEEATSQIPNNQQQQQQNRQHQRENPQFGFDLNMPESSSFSDSEETRETTTLFTSGQIDQTAALNVVDPITDLIIQEGVQDDGQSSEQIQMIPLQMLTPATQFDEQQQREEQTEQSISGERDGSKNDQHQQQQTGSTLQEQASPVAAAGHRKRGRNSKKQTVEEGDDGKHKNELPSRSGVEKAVETEQNLAESVSTHSVDPNRYGIVKRMRKNKKYTLARILAMYVYGNNRRLFFVEWDGREIETCWLQSENMNAQEMVTKFIEEYSMHAALSAFSDAGPVTEHVANLLNNNTKAKNLMKKLGINPGKMDTTKNIVFAKSINATLKEKALNTIDKFIENMQISE